MTRKLYWIHPAFYLLLMFNAFIFILVALIVRKQGTIHVCLCERHRQLRRRGIWIGWGGGLLSLVGLIAVTASVNAEEMVLLSLGVGVLLLLVSVIVGSVMAQIVTPQRIDKQVIRARVGKAFLASLPEARQM